MSTGVTGVAVHRSKLQCFLIRQPMQVKPSSPRELTQWPFGSDLRGHRPVL